MVLLDPAQPRGLAFQMARVEEHLSALPRLEDSGMPEPPLRLARQVRMRLEGFDANAMTCADIGSLQGDLAALSETISQRYFLQEDQTAGASATRLIV